MTKLEQVKQALRDACRKEYGSDWNNDVAIAFARAALEATKEPTEAMLAGSNWPDDMSRDIFNAMIQSALDEKP